MEATMVPERSLQQRLDALERANRVRTHRARLKKDIKAGRLSPIDVLLSGDPLVANMKVMELLLAAPRIGRVKANRLLFVQRVSPSKTIEGISERQKTALVSALRVTLRVG